MADNIIQVNVTANKPKSVTVSSANVGTEITASSDTGRRWAQTSKNWAVSDFIVDNTDYSSKYYANKAKESANNAQGFESAIREVYNGFLGETTEAIENVQGARDEAITNIETSRVEAIVSINSTKTTILNDIEFVADGEKKEIVDLIDSGKEELKESIGDVKVLTTLEIGDIGFTQMAIDESKGKRRILNGQLIIQEQYVQFTNIIKESVALNPSLACTEAEWQTEVTMNTFGLCGKFVIDNEGGTIRLPKYPNYFIGGVDNIASVVGNGKALGITSDGSNVCYMNTGTGAGTYMLWTRSTSNVLPSASSNTNAPWASSPITVGVSTNPATSGLEAHINKKQIAGTYFIQVATGAETEDNIINEIELNNPFSLLDYKFSEYELNNISWLRSEGQYNSKAIYPAVYDLLLKIYNGTETKAGVSVKLSTEAYTNYDFVLNTAEETFRLPINVTNSAQGYLYFYVGETVQNANLINAGRIEEKVANLITDNSSIIAGYGMPSSKYIDLTLGASSSTYTAPANGWIVLCKNSSATNQYLCLGLGLADFNQRVYSSANNQTLSLMSPVTKNTNIYVEYSLAGVTKVFRFYYAEGDK